MNGQYLFLADYERLLSQSEQALLSQGVDPDSEEGQAQLAQLRQDVLESLIDSLLIEQGAKSLGVTVGDAELEAQVEADIAAGGGLAAFEEWLEATGQTRDDYRKALRQAMLSQRVLDTVSEDVSPYVEQVHLRHIMVDSEKEALQIDGRLRAGDDFGVLAQEHSLDLATRDAGGDLGWFPRGLLAPEMEAVAFGLEPGGMSQVLQLGEGFHIIEVLERDPERLLSAELAIEYRLAVFGAWLAEQREAADIQRPDINASAP